MRGKMSRRTRFAIAAFCDSLSWPSSCWPLIRQGVPLAACAMTAAFAMAQPLPLPREEPLAPLQLPATTRAVLAPPSEDGSDAAFPVGAPSDSDTATALTAEEVAGVAAASARKNARRCVLKRGGCAWSLRCIRASTSATCS